MNKRLLLFFISVIILVPAYAQYLTGKVVADDDGLPLVGATVWYQENPAVKVRVGESGQYRIRFRQGTLVFHCFGFNDQKVTVKVNRPVNIRLKSESMDMTEVVVEVKRKKYKRKGNPAVEMMQKVIAARKSADMRQNDYVTYDKYSRTMLALNEYNDTAEVDEKIKKKKFLKDYAEYCPDIEKTIVPISIEEKRTTELYRKSDDKNKTIVHGYHAESLLDVLTAGEFLETKFKDNLKDVDLYKDEVVLLEHNFISPIGGQAAIRFYHYAIDDSIYLDGQKCFKLSFSPANRHDIGFSGYLYILADSTWRLKRASFGVPVVSNINFIKGMDVDQEYVSLPSGEQICSKNRMMLQLKLTSYLNKIFVDYNVRYSNWNFAPIADEDIEFIGEEKYEKGAKNRDAAYWSENRPDTLTHAQANVAEMKKKFVDRPAVKAAIYGLRIILDNYLETSANPNKPSKVIIGPFFSMLGTSWVEGFRIRLGAETTGAFNKHWFLKGWVKYGFKDKKVKGHAEVTYSFNEKEKQVLSFPIRTLTLSYTNDIQSPADKYLQFDKDNAFMALTWHKTHYQSYFQQARLKYDWEFNNGLRLNTILNYETNTGAGDLYFNTLRDWDEAEARTRAAHKDIGAWVPTDNIIRSRENRYVDLSIGAEYQPGVKIINTKTKRFLANREAPIYGFQHTVGLYSLDGGSSHAFNYTEFTLKKRFWLKSWGSIDMFNNASFQWNQVPFQLLCIPRANLSFVKSDNTFSLIRNLEFLNDRTFTTMWRWDLNGKIFNRIPGLKKLKWREAIGINMMWGYLTDKNNPLCFDPNNEKYFKFYNEPGNPDSGVNWDAMKAAPGYDYLYRFPGEWQTVKAGDNYPGYSVGERRYTTTTQIMNSWKPYIEVSFGIHNIFKFFSVDYFHRLTYINDGSNGAPKTQKWGLRFAFQASF